jgi:1-deoxy-D-xylulose-5-phosphate synthase
MPFDLINIKDPSFLKDLSNAECKVLAQDIRDFLIQSLSETGGHLSSNLGVVELTIALHKVFDSPKDKLIFDVGHQSYTHKILTGRASMFGSLRQFHGLSGFLKHDESIHDIYEAGHSSTSIAAAAGMEFAKQYNGNGHKIIPIIGDGALTSGMALEALNFLGAHPDHQPIIILNDNEMSISQNIGYLANILNSIRSKAGYRKLKSKTKRLIPKFLYKLTSKVERGIKGFVTGNTLFDDLGFSYYGPINGHDFKELEKYLQMAKKINKPCVIHVLTEKGKGYKWSEGDQSGYWHGVGPFDIETGAPKNVVEKNWYSYSQIIAKYMMDYASNNKDFHIVIPAMIQGSAMKEFQMMYPTRITDVGIAEQMAVTMSSGLALEGIDVFTPIYSTFIQRAYDQVNHDVARQKAKVIFGIDRAGLVGADGETHQGIFDIPLLRHIPNMVIAHPRNAKQAFMLLNYAFKENTNPFALRYERATVFYDFEAEGIPSELATCSWELVKKGTKATFISFGTIIEEVVNAYEDEKLDVGVVDARFIKPLDESMLHQILKQETPIILYEEGIYSGGFASAVLEFAAIHHYDMTRVHIMAIQDDYVPQGTKQELLKELNLDLASIILKTKEII